mgnify:CR=1 FL=1
MKWAVGGVIQAQAVHKQKCNHKAILVSYAGKDKLQMEPPDTLKIVPLYRVEAYQGSFTGVSSAMVSRNRKLERRGHPRRSRAKN